MIKAKPFKYKRSKKYVMDVLANKDILPPAPTLDEYTGQIDGIKASHGEENLLRAAMQTGAIQAYDFRVATCAPRNFPGWKELDFLFTTKDGEYIAVQVKDYTFVHHGEASTAQDAVDDALMLQDFTKNGVQLRENKVYSVDAMDVDTLEQAKKIVEEIIL